MTDVPDPPAGAALPPDAYAYRRTDLFTESTVPPGLLRAHSTKQGVWGLIHVVDGALAYRIEDPRRPPSVTVLTPSGAPGVVEPTILHSVEPQKLVRFYVEFYRRETGGDEET
ncbi:DUF1971 domain-containing protein [Phenylobacterium sp.]|jgi:tellurite resistance-related uncharacterized protein|uniref:DUF1971 domain-containing protein n=1 Tax=Phenylobacterium sp. TaxID=1871053 RepID=UPI003568E378